MLTSVYSKRLDSNQEPMVSGQKSLTTKLLALITPTNIKSNPLLTKLITFDWLIFIGKPKLAVDCSDDCHDQIIYCKLDLKIINSPCEF